MTKQKASDIMASNSSIMTNNRVSIAKVGGGQDAPQVLISNGEDNKLLGRGSSVAAAEFPLDHILPVFNLSTAAGKGRNESSFIPTLKVKQKDNVNMAQLGKRGGQGRGTAVQK